MHGSLLRFALDTQNILNVMSDFVSQDVGLRELAGSAELAGQLIVEAQIDVHLLVPGAVERAGRRFRATAGGLRRVAIKHEFGMVVLAA